MKVLSYARCTAAIVTMFFAGCQTTPETIATSNCNFGATKFSADFEGGRLSKCRKIDNGVFELTILPENTPINSSAWYAFDVESPAGKPVSIELYYPDGYHRYAPHVLQPNGDWKRVDLEVTSKDRQDRARFQLTPVRQLTRFAGQPLFLADTHMSWMDKMTAKSFVTKSVIGASVEERPIYKLEEVDDPSKPYILIVGRQHPPETTGAEALVPFVETVWGDSELATQFRAKYNLIVVPFMNPDGVAHGHWRHNMNGLDLNRDWGPFTQPETQTIQSELKRFENGVDDITLFIDFHSTWRNLVYTQTEEEPATPKGFTKEWLAKADARLDDEVYAFTREESPNSGKPTSKNYMNETFGITAVTYEVGDDTEADDIDISARVFAEEMMGILLGTGN